MQNLVFFNGVYTLSIAFSLQIKGNVTLVGYIKNQKRNVHITSLNYTNMFAGSNVLSWFFFNKIFFKKKAFTYYAGNINNVYLPINSSTYKIYKILKQIYPKSNFIFYEEGLLSYLKPIFNKKLNKLLQQYSSYYIGYNLLTDYLKFYLANCKINIINKQALYATFNNQQSGNKALLLDKNKRYCLVLPQYYYQNNVKKFKQLAFLYAKELQELEKNNYTIIFKEHPKAKNSLLIHIQQYCNVNNYIVITEAIPAEAINFNIPINMVFSVYSTALLSINYLYNIPFKSSNNLLNFRINYFSFYPTLSALLIKYIINLANYDTINKEQNLTKIFYTKNYIFNFIIKICLVKKAM